MLSHLPYSPLNPESSLPQVDAKFTSPPPNNLILCFDRLELLQTLSARENELFILRAQGNSAGTIAVAMGISIKTVDSHQENIKNKLRLGSYRELTAFALYWGSLHLPPPTEETRSTANLTPREIQVGDLLAQGKARAEIAATLRLSARTVDTYLTNLRSKLGVRSRGNLVHAIRAYASRQSMPIDTSSALRGSSLLEAVAECAESPPGFSSPLGRITLMEDPPVRKEPASSNTTYSLVN